MDQPGGEGARLPGRSVKLFLVDGTAHGVVLAEIGNWSGKILAGPRGRLPELMQRPEAQRTGVYVLFGPDPERSDGSLAYIGEADSIAKRMRTHLAMENKDFFNRLAFIVTSDNTLTKGPVRYLESRLIRLTLDAGSVSLTNDRHPEFALLPEADKADMETFIDQVKLILPLLGFDLFRPRVLERTAAGAGQGSGGTFTFSAAGASATARETEDGFVIVTGSTARRSSTETFPAGYRALRDRLVVEGRLGVGPLPELYTFISDVVFSSPSAAASIVAGRSASGPLEWKLTGTGQTYRDWRAERLA